MATFLNLSVSPVELTDENGITYHFDGGEERGGLSNYFSKYTSTNTDLTTPILRLVGDLDGDGTVPVPAIRNENMVFQPGVGVPHSYTAELSDAPSPAMTPVDTSGATGPRKHRAVFDLQKQLGNNTRKIDMRFVEIRPVPTSQRTFDGFSIDGLNATKTITIDESWVPLKLNGITATESDAAANPAVDAGSHYTVFGVIEVYDDSLDDDGTYYFSIRDENVSKFVAADDNPDGFTTPTTASVDVGSGQIQFDAYTDGSSDDSASVTVTIVTNPDSAAQLGQTFEHNGLEDYTSGLFFNIETGRLFLVRYDNTLNGTVYQYDPDDSYDFSD